jgi:flagellar assembly protein FliH
MSSEILVGGQSSADRVFWRTVTAVPSTAVRGSRSDAEREIAQRLEQARRDGIAEGVAAGRREAEQQILPAVEDIAHTVVELARMRESIREEATQELVRLATSIAARVIHREVAVDPDALAGLITAAFSKLQSREVSRARVHPALEALLRRCIEQYGATVNLSISADPGLNPGDLVFETSQGILDTSVDTQLREIERGLIDRLGR